MYITCICWADAVYEGHRVEHDMTVEVFPVGVGGDDGLIAVPQQTAGEVEKTALSQAIDYGMNPGKTHDLVTGINCDPDTAHRDMQTTKRRWDKRGGVLPPGPGRRPAVCRPRRYSFGRWPNMLSPLPGNGPAAPGNLPLGNVTPHSAALRRCPSKYVIC